MYEINTAPKASWAAAMDELIGPMQPPAQAPKPKTDAQKAKARKAFWGKLLKALGTTWEWLTRRARDLALVAIVLGTGVAVFQGSLTSATLFGFSGWSAIAFAIMPDALMVISASVMRGTGVAAAQRREAKISMYFSLTFSLVSNMIAALYITMPEVFEPGIRTGGAVAYHAIIVVFLWRAVETVTKTREDTPSVRRNPKARKASGTLVPAQRSVKA